MINRFFVTKRVFVSDADSSGKRKYIVELYIQYRKKDAKVKSKALMLWIENPDMSRLDKIYSFDTELFENNDAKLRTLQIDTESMSAVSRCHFMSAGTMFKENIKPFINSFPEIAFESESITINRAKLERIYQKLCGIVDEKSSCLSAFNDFLKITKTEIVSNENYPQLDRKIAYEGKWGGW